MKRKFPDTQIGAYQEIQQDLPKKRRAVLDAISNSDGVALFQLVNILNLPVNHISGRITELHNSGLIIDSGRRAVNPFSKKSAIVWTVVTKQELAPVVRCDGDQAVMW